MARRCGIGSSLLSRLLSEDHVPGLATAVRIREATGIPVEAWTSPRHVPAEAPTDPDHPVTGAA